MRKRLISHPRATGSSSGPPWLDVAHVAQVEITSEDPAFPIEAALFSGRHAGWRASEPGVQVIRLVFDQPQTLHRIRLVFSEEQRQRTQEFVVQWSADGGQSYREIVRQQYTFSPPGTIREVEDYHKHLEGVTDLELRIVPDLQGSDVCATLGELRLL